MQNDVYAKIMARDATEEQRLNGQFHLITEYAALQSERSVWELFTEEVRDIESLHHLIIDSAIVNDSRGLNKPFSQEAGWREEAGKFRALGWIVHPSIKLRESPSVADIATGTGLFLRCLSADYPNARLDGYDISADMFPNQSDLPPQITLKLRNAKDPLPSQLHGVYDLIHIQYLIIGLEPEDWEVVLKNLIPALKPGGAIQWTEPAVSQYQVVRGRPDASITAMTIFGDMFRGIPAMQRRATSGWNTLPGLMRDAGLRVETDVVSIDRKPESRRLIAENGFVALLASARKMSMASVPGALSMERLDELEAMALEEIESGAYPLYTVHTAVGFKPKSKPQ